MENFYQNPCRNCGSLKTKSWEELSGDDKMIIDKLPQNQVYSDNEKKKHRFCKRCLAIKELEEIKV